MNEHTSPQNAQHAPMFNDRRAMLAGIGGLAAGAMMAGRAQAGPLSPPAGPIASTYKTLQEAEPRILVNATNTPGDADSVYRISQPGSYYLGGNVTGVAAKHGIEIAASNVTLDLNGFELAGVPESRNGIFASTSDRTDLEIRNGSISGWGWSGVDTATVNLQGTVIRQVRSGKNTEYGLKVGAAATIDGCTVHDNLGGGIDTQSHATIAHTTANNNTGRGIYVTFSSLVTECVAFSNTSDGIAINAGTIVSRCSAYSNGGDGITVFSGGTVEHCNVRSNTGDGIQVSGLSNVLNNSCVSNGTGSTGGGIHATGSDNRIEGNHCSGNVRNFDIDAGGNFIARNTASALAITVVNWDVATGNAILVVNATTANALFGDSGGTSPGSTNPNANYTY